MTAAGAGATLAAVFLATCVVEGALPYPGCGFKHLTGLPCPGCGGLRSLAALAHGHAAEAFALNPLAGGGAVLLVFALPAALIDAAWNRGRAAAWLGRAVGGRRAGWLCAVALAATWVYLVAAGR
jgi:hypothetical protein